MDNNKKQTGYDTCHLRIEFNTGKPWFYPLALNGREPTRFYVGGVEYVPANSKEARSDD